MTTTSHISLHLVTGIEAVGYNTTGQPLVLRIQGRYGGTDLTLFFENEDLTKKLVEAINAATMPKAPVVICPQEIAAYAAAAKTWSGL